MDGTFFLEGGKGEVGVGGVGGVGIKKAPQQNCGERWLFNFQLSTFNFQFSIFNFRGVLAPGEIVVDAEGA